MQEQDSPTEAEWAWLAGLFEGEGCINFTDKNSVCVRVGMTDRDVIETLDRLVPCPTVYIRPTKNPKHNTQYIWYLAARDDVRAFIEGIRPWLHSRRGKKADEALERLKRNRGTYHKKDRCRHGHVWAEVGVYVGADGKRRCKGCLAVTSERYRREKREQYLKNHRERERERRKQRKAQLGDPPFDGARG